MKKKTKSPAVLETKANEIEAFVSGAEKQTEANSYPWQASDIDDSQVKVFNLKLPESYAEKLDFLVKKTVPKTTKQRYLLERLLPLIDEELKKRNIPQ